MPRICAAGDVASAWHPHYRRHVRVEHWANALNQGTTAGRNAFDARHVYDRLPYLFSDQYDLGMEYVGHSSPGDAVAVRGDRGSRELIAFWHSDGIVSAAMNVNVWDVVDDLEPSWHRASRSNSPASRTRTFPSPTSCADGRPSVVGRVPWRSTCDRRPTSRTSAPWSARSDPTPACAGA